MSLRLYFSRGSSSIVSMIALEESGLDYALTEVPISQGANRSADYLALNPSGRIPTLMIGGHPLTETHAILTYIADSVPELGLLPHPGTLARAQAHEWMNYIASVGHIAARTLRRPLSFVPQEAVTALKAQGLVTLRDVLAVVEDRLGEGPYALGETVSLVDAYLVWAHGWANPDTIPEHRPALPNFDAHYARMMERPAVQRAYIKEKMA